MYSPYAANYIQREVVDWAMQGAPIPAPHPVKVLHLAWILQVSNIGRFIETGTLAGNTSGMIGLMPDVHVDTIEITEHYFNLARERFGENTKITQHFGDSTHILPNLLKNLEEPALFWLDAHHSMGKTGCGDKLTPVSEEIDAILEHSIDGHIVAIDDIRSFTGRSDYPMLDKLMHRLREAKPHYDSIVRHDILTYAPKSVFEKINENPFHMNQISIISKV
jgi:hypothetical protein